MICIEEVYDLVDDFAMFIYFCTLVYYIISIVASMALHKLLFRLVIASIEFAGLWDEVVLAFVLLFSDFTYFVKSGLYHWHLFSQ